MHAFMAVVVTLGFSLCVLSTPQAPSPSARAKARRKPIAREIKSDSDEARCPRPLRPCPILRPDEPYLKANVSTINNGHPALSSWECLNVQEELSACGSCDNDCMKIPHVESIGCEFGVCKIFSCKRGSVPQVIRDKIDGEKILRCVCKNNCALQNKK
ncbi:hypothetical protein O181_001460 [Austropuccinia psidii MF-1]|uniref:Protein CPL1-like domain-containing protein n=1 Tax=Austropuccinia psidii MF-1 TaxID=1389203 RepID=A0A9Q3BB16_9BASI|nr:hypothetical protein [Austropuccinia psidii MF-1]